MQPKPRPERYASPFFSRLACLLPVVCLALFTGCGDDDGAADGCDLAAPDCPEGQVCLPQAEGDPICQDVCDPTAPDACGDGLACERLDTGDHACFEPVYLEGRVFDLTDDLGVVDALVIAADDTGAAVTNVVVSGADGYYELRIPVTRDASGVPQGGIFTLRVAAQDYVPYPAGLRPAIPIDASGAGYSDGAYRLSNPTTDVGLIPLPGDEQGLGSISGAVGGDLSGGALVVAECGDPPCPLAYADLGGDYTIYNVPDGTYTVRGYKAGLQLEPADVDLANNDHLTGVDLAVSDLPLSTISGSINVVNPGDGDVSSVVLVPESSFMQLSDSFVRGEVAPGLRDPAPGLPPDVTGAFTIEGVPDGNYVVLAAFENDFLVRDPDPGIAGTQIVHQEVPDPTDGNEITIDTSFKVTGALTMFGPGAEGPEAVADASALVFSWKDDSSEDFYAVVVYDAFGNEVWDYPDAPRVTGGEVVEVDYAGPALTPGMYYQWRATSHRVAGPISTTEDLLGVFYIPGTVQ